MKHKKDYTGHLKFFAEILKEASPAPDLNESSVYRVFAFPFYDNVEEQKRQVTPHLNNNSCLHACDPSHNFFPKVN